MTNKSVMLQIEVEKELYDRLVAKKGTKRSWKTFLALEILGEYLE